MDLSISKKLLFIGAGASYGARCNLAIHPPLGKDLLAFLKEKAELLLSPKHQFRLPEAWYLTNESHKLLLQAKETDFESYIGAINRNDRETIHKFLQVLFSNLSSDDLDFGFNDGPDLYDVLIEKTIEKDPEQWTVISLNYDVLFEQSLIRRNIRFHYPEFPRGLGITDNIGIGIFKPHGSINFFNKADIRFSYGGPPDPSGAPSTYRNAKNGDLIIENPIWFATPLDFENIVHRAVENTLSPVIANFTIGKEADYNLSELERVRAQCLNIAPTFSGALIVGVNPLTHGDDDPFVHSLLRNLFGEIDVVTYGELDGKAYNQLYPNAAISTAGLAGYLK